MINLPVIFLICGFVTVIGLSAVMMVASQLDHPEIEPDTGCERISKEGYVEKYECCKPVVVLGLRFVICQHCSLDFTPTPMEERLSCEEGGYISWGKTLFFEIDGGVDSTVKNQAKDLIGRGVSLLNEDIAEGGTVDSKTRQNAKDLIVRGLQSLSPSIGIQKSDPKIAQGADTLINSILTAPKKDIPDMTGGATGGILQDKSITNGKNTIPKTLDKAGSAVIDKNTVGASPYIGDPDTWCGPNPNDPTGQTTTCTCKGGSTDCLHMCQIIDCPFGCISSSEDCKVDVPKSSISTETVKPQTQTQGTLSPNVKAGAGGGVTADPDSPARVSPYIGDPDTWCKDNPDGIGKTCTCKAGTTDCLHMCGVVNCPAGCISGSGDCEVDIPAAATETPATNNDNEDSQPQTQGTVNPDVKAGAGGGVTADPDSP